MAIGSLHLVATPLGNLEDLSPRAAATLAQADFIFAEDTRTAARLLSHLGLRKPLASCHDANESARTQALVAHLQAGEQVAYISEAGTPAVSDPGFKLVQAAISADAKVIPIPGPSAPLAALVGAGLPTDTFYFGGFLPRKPGARKAAIASVSGLAATLIWFESPLRVHTTLQDLKETLGNRRACVARELTKTHEEFRRGLLSELIELYSADRPLGEVTLVVEGASEKTGQARDEDIQTRARELLRQGMSVRDITRLLVAESGHPRREIYGRVVAWSKRNDEPPKTEPRE